jgi:signal transduction histidine kinase
MKGRAGAGRAAAPSLTLRLAWRLGALMLAAVVVAATAVAWRAITAVRQMDDQALYAQAREVAAHLARAADGTVRARLPPALAAQFAGGDGQSLYLVFDREGRLLAGSDAGAASVVRPFLPARGGLFKIPDAGAAGRAMIGWMLLAGDLRVAVVQASEQQEALIGTLEQEFFGASLWLLVPIALAAVGIAVLTLRNGLRPVREASAAATRVGPSHPGVRLPTAGLARELVPLVAAVNEALARLERGIEVQRRFSADAAHALRTPLSVLIARLDTLGEGVLGSGAEEARWAALRGDVDRMARLVSQMLLMARLEGMPVAVSEVVDLREVAVEAISALAPLAVRMGVEIALAEGTRGRPAEARMEDHREGHGEGRRDGHAVRVAGNRAALVLAVSNLLENALAHAPVGSEVEVEVATGAGGTGNGAMGTIVVRDRGPGVAEAEREAIFARFRRGARPRDAGMGGAGLGLAIVAEIARQHGGSAWVEAREGGGAAFVVALPGGLRGGLRGELDRQLHGQLAGS